MSLLTGYKVALPGAPEAGKTDAAIHLENVSVRYRVPQERIPSFKEYAIRRLKRQIVYNEFWALKDVSLEIRRGEVFGIIGPNGAGKSTLLKVVARVLRPTVGRVRVRGRVAPLLELGAGFDMELTGRENIYLNGAILGYTRADIAARFDRIVNFAGLREFIDMIARLGFAVATDVQPEVLIVDEVLAVGDAEFQKKSAERIAELRNNGATILMVSHNLAAVQSMCWRAAWLHHGQLRALGPAEETIRKYQHEVGPA